MMKFVLVIVAVLSAAVLAVMYVEIEKMKRDPSRIPVTVGKEEKILILHSFRDEIHRYIGEIKLPHSCYRISTDVIRDPKVRSIARIAVTTDDRMLEEKICAKISTRYAFEAIVDAPEDLQVTLFIDGKETAFVEEKTQWQSPKGTLVAPVIPANPKP